MVSTHFQVMSRTARVVSRLSSGDLPLTRSRRAIALPFSPTTLVEEAITCTPEDAVVVVVVVEENIVTIEIEITGTGGEPTY